MRSLRVIIAEAKPLVLQGLIRELESAGLDIVASVTMPGEALDAIHTHIPDVVVIATDLQGGSGLEVFEKIKDSIPTILLASKDDRELVFEALLMGARGYLRKWRKEIALSDAVSRVARGEIVVEGPSLSLFIEAVRDHAKTIANGRTTLSPRETEVLQLVSKGRNSATIAEMLGISKPTVRQHISNAYAKLGVKNRAAAIREAMRRGLLDNES